jgi:hypothetical protein
MPKQKNSFSARIDGLRTAACDLQETPVGDEEEISGVEAGGGDLEMDGAMQSVEEALRRLEGALRAKSRKRGT